MIDQFMINQEDIYNKIKRLLPTAEEVLILNLITQIEQQMDGSVSVEEIIRKVVLRRTGYELRVGTKIDTKA